MFIYLSIERSCIEDIKVHKLFKDIPVAIEKVMADAVVAWVAISALYPRVVIYFAGTLFY